MSPLRSAIKSPWSLRYKPFNPLPILCWLSSNRNASGTVKSASSGTVIEARPGWRAIDFGEIWDHRELLYFLVWRDIKVRYKQTVVGAAL